VHQKRNLEEEKEEEGPGEKAKDPGGEEDDSFVGVKRKKMKKDTTIDIVTRELE